MAKQTFLDSRKDLTWLAEVHGVETANAECAVIYGNEDAPDRVEVFAINHYQCEPVVWVPDPYGDSRFMVREDSRS